MTNRRSCTYHAQGSNRYSAVDGTKLINMLVSSHDWLDPSTFRIMFDLHNEGPANSNLRPIGGPWSLFSRLRILCGGQLVEDIPEYASIHEMFSILGAEGARANDYAEGIF